MVLLPSKAMKLSEGDRNIWTPLTVVATPDLSVSPFGRTIPDPDGKSEKPLGKCVAAGASGMVLLPSIAMKLPEGANDT